MSRAAQIMLEEMTVANVFSQNQYPVLPPSMRWIMEVDWAADEVPAVGEVWNGQIPATFSPPPPPPQEDLAKSALDIINELRAKAAEMIDRADALVIKLG